MESIGIKLGKEIRRIRNANGMSQEELAFRAGISAAHLGQIERATKNPTVETTARIADALGVSLPELFSFDVDVKKRDDIILNKITIQAASMSEKNQKELLRMMRIFKRVNNDSAI